LISTWPCSVTYCGLILFYDLVHFISGLTGLASFDLGCLTTGLTCYLVADLFVRPDFGLPVSYLFGLTLLPFSAWALFDGPEFRT
jgi:hypothetical protein